MGVQLFFLISGYVIFMSLERSANVADFAKRRWLRLFPAMLLATVFIFVTAPLFTRPGGQPALVDTLPGLLFIEPEWIAAATGWKQEALEGSFWSLYVEVKFYVVAAVLFFGIGPRVTLLALSAMFLAPMVVGRMPWASHVYDLANLLSSWHWGWFAAGALYYKARRAPGLFWLALPLSLLAATKVQPDCIPAAACMALLFAVAQCSVHVQRLLEARFLVFLGAISYPLYLIHENMMVAMIATMHRAAPGISTLALAAGPICVVIGFAWVISKGEPLLRSALTWRRNPGQRQPTA